MDKAHLHQVELFSYRKEVILDSLVLDGKNLTIDQVMAVAHGQPGAPEVRLSDEAQRLVNRAAEAVAQLLARGEVAYGITTGFGAFKSRVIPLDQVEELQRNIVISHAVGVGDPFDAPTTRAIMLIRAYRVARRRQGRGARRDHGSIRHPRRGLLC